MIDVTEVENGLRGCEARLEEIGRSICSAPGGGQSWSAINRALEGVRDAIHAAYLMMVG